MREIEVYGGHLAKVSDEDYEWAIQFSWRMSSGYPTRTVQRRHSRRLHQDIAQRMGVEGQVDHENLDRMDNCRSNLRPCTAAENMQNRSSKGASPYRGVSFSKSKGKWRARGTVNKKTTYIGYFDSEEEAGRAAANWRAENMPFSAEAMA